MSRATRLRITQSAVSKRLKALEAEVGEPVVERHGRRLVLTPHATRLLERLGPLLAEVRAGLKEESHAARATVTIGVSSEFSTCVTAT